MTQFQILTHEQLTAKIVKFDVKLYCATRNYLDGWVSQLSPYITHGVITIDEIVRLSLNQYTIDDAEMRYKELLRREYFTQVHRWQWGAIFADMEEDKTGIAKYNILPTMIETKTFESVWVNEIIQQMETSGYLHNHQRMWLASYMSHYQRLYWRKCADRSYYHFIDGELWSNHLSWQRVQSTFAHKPYYMNEENLNRYGTYHDPVYRGSYEEIEQMLFDTDRVVKRNKDEDMSYWLRTDVSMIEHAIDQYDWYTILTPWDLHPSKIIDPRKTICVLDHNFTHQHPRSSKRVAFVQSYCDLYSIGFVYGDVHQIVQNSHDLSVYETRNPEYRQAYEQASTRSDVIYHQHQRCSPVVAMWYTKKFFPFWAQTKKHLSALEQTISQTN